MNKTRKFVSVVFAALFFFVLSSFISPKFASAHCDTLDGPVVNAARKAMEKDNINYMLIWVRPEKEDEIRKALKRAIEKKKKAKNKKETEDAEMELFETLVRVHREGEGAKYEGVKPAGSVEEEIAMADKAVETGNLDGVLPHINNPENEQIIRHLFHRVRERSDYDVDDVNAGREFIEAYVVFIHSVEKAVKGEILQMGKLHEH